MRDHLLISFFLLAQLETNEAKYFWSIEPAPSRVDLVIANYLNIELVVTWSYSVPQYKIQSGENISYIKLLRTTPIGYVHQPQFVDYFDTFRRLRLFMIINSHFLSHSRPSNSCSNSLTTKMGFQLY